MNSTSRVRALPEHLDALRAFRAFLASNPMVVLLSLLAAGLLFGGSIAYLPSFVGPGRRLAPSSLLALIVLTTAMAAFFYARLTRMVWSRASYDRNDLGAIPVGRGQRVLMQGWLWLVVLPAGLFCLASPRLPSIVSAGLGLAFAMLLQRLLFFAPQAALAEGCGLAASLRRSQELVAASSDVVNRHILTMTAAVAAPLALALWMLSRVEPRSPGGVVSAGDIGVWLVLGFALGTLAIAFALVAPAVVATALFVAGLPEPPPPPRRGASSEAMTARATEPSSAATGTVLFNQAMGVLGLGQVDRAIALFEAAVEQDPALGSGPRFATACLALAEALARGGRVESAIGYYRAYLEHNPRARNRDSILQRIEALKTGASGRT